MFNENRMNEICEEISQSAKAGEKTFLVDGCIVVYRDKNPPSWALAQRYTNPVDPLSQMHEDALAIDARLEIENQLRAEGIEIPLPEA